jgi:hypothetical protein
MSHLFGMTSGGLSGVDLRMQLGGVAEEIFGSSHFPNFQPHALNATLWDLINNAGPGSIHVEKNAGELISVEKVGPHIASMSFANGLVVTADVFLDCSYEGDLLRLSNTSYAVGREAMSEYNESAGGVNGGRPWASYSWKGMSPWVDDTNTSLIPTVLPFPSSLNPGDSDDLVQTYNYRLCLTNNSANRRPFDPPENYTPASTEFLRRWFLENAAQVNAYSSILSLFLVRHLGDDKVDINQGVVPGLSDMPFLQLEYPLGNWSTRAAICAQHEWHTRAAWTFLRTDDAVPAHLRDEAATWGLPLDEFIETNNFPPNLYVRESIRMRGDVVFSESDVWGHEVGANNGSVGLSQWLIDIHSEQRVALPPSVTGRGWEVADAGDVNTAGAAWQLTEIPFAVIIPRRSETQNLIVPVCASFTHVAFATYRLEPQYAVFGQSAAVAAVLASRASRPAVVHDVDIPTLQAVLVSQGQIIHAGGSADTGALFVANCTAPDAATTVWAHKARENGTISLVRDSLGLCASVYAYSNTSGAPLWSAACHASDPSKPANQAFDLIPGAVKGTSLVRSRLSGLCVALKDGVGPSIAQGDCATSPAWTVSSSPQGSLWTLAESPEICVNAPKSPKNFS